MPSIEVEIPSLDPQEIEAAVIEVVVNRTLRWASIDEDGDPHQVPTAVSQALEEKLVETVREEAKKYGPGIVSEILAGNVPQTDRFGVEHGKSKSVHEIVAEQVQRSIEGYDGYRRDGPTKLEKMIREEVNVQIGEHLAKITADAIAPIREAVDAEVRAAVAKALKAVKP